MSTLKFISPDDAIQKLKQFNSKRDYWLMYSSVFGGIVRDPALMIIPIDDHMVHRGDGIFEALRFHGGKLFELEAHVNRLFRSADLVSMKMPKSREEIIALCLELANLSPQKDGFMRIFVSRGFGDFSANPYSTLGAEIFILTMPFKNMPKEKYLNGASAVFSSIPVKPGFFSQVKSCNYLPNVLAKKESVDRGVDFSIGVTSDGKVGEGPTENIMLLTPDHDLIASSFDYTLRGTTLERTLEIARVHSAQLGLREVKVADLRPSDFFEAREVMMVGTTLGVLPITQIDKKPIGERSVTNAAFGVVGPVARQLNAYLEAVMGV